MLVVVQLLAVGTSAFRVELLSFIIRNSEAHFIATAVVVRTRVQAGNALGLAAVNFDSVQSIRLGLSYHDLFLLATQLVKPYYGIQSPVSDVHPVIVNDDRERMSNQSRVDGFYVRSV